MLKFREYFKDEMSKFCVGEDDFNQGENTSVHCSMITKNKLRNCYD